MKNLIKRFRSLNTDLDEYVYNEADRAALDENQSKVEFYERMKGYSERLTDLFVEFQKAVEEEGSL